MTKVGSSNGKTVNDELWERLGPECSKGKELFFLKGMNYRARRKPR